MTEYAPAAILWLANEITGPDGIGTAQLSGVIGDRAHTYGYHRCRDVLPGDDYSVQLSADQRGDGEAASALDISYGPDDQKLVTRRLMDAMKARDARIHPYVREFFGTLNGSTVTGWDGAADGYTSSDDSHLWHVHLSFYRQYATDQTCMAGIRDVILGREEDDDMPTIETSLTAAGQALPWGERRNVTWTHENADPAHAHQDGAYPGYVAPVSDYLVGVAMGQITGVKPGDLYQVHLVQYAWDNKAGKAKGAPYLEVLADYACATGDQYFNVPVRKYAAKGTHTYVAVTVWPGDAADGKKTSRPAPRLVSASLRVSQRDR